MTIEQQRAIAMARARMRMTQGQQPQAPARFDAVPTQFGGDGSPQSEPPPLPPQTLGQQVVGGLRDVAMGIPKFAALPVDMGVMAVNAGQSLIDPTAQPFRTVSEAGDQSLNDMGVPQTQNPLIRGVNEAVGGGAVSIGAKGVQIGREAFAPQAPLQTAAQRRAGRAVREIAGGPDERAILAEQLRNYKSPVSGVNATVAEAVQGMPEGSPLQALQDVVSRVSGAQYGSPSTQFGRQLAGNQAAREAATETLGSSHGAKREAILGNANNLSDRLRRLRDVVAQKIQQEGGWLRETGKAQTDEAVANNRLAGVGPQSSEMLERAKALRSPEKPSSVDAYLRPAPKQAPIAGMADDYAAQASKARGAAGDFAWEMDKAGLERAGAQLEKELLENTGLNSLGPESLRAGTSAAMANPRVYANEIASKTYQSFVDDVARITQKDGTIDARALDELRKSFGPKLTALFQKEGWNTKDAAFAKAMRSAQGFIDDAIEAAGGTGYKDELARYSQGIGAIQDDAARVADMYNPLQKSTVPLVKLLEDQMEKGLQNVPSFMSPKLWLAKAGAREMFRQSRPGVVNEMSQLLRKPQDMAWALDERNAQGATEALQRALMQYGRRAPGAIGASRE